VTSINNYGVRCHLIIIRIPMSHGFSPSSPIKSHSFIPLIWRCRCNMLLVGCNRYDIDIFIFCIDIHIYIYMGMDQYLLIPFLVGWTSIYQLFWGSLGTRVLTHPHMRTKIFTSISIRIFISNRSILMTSPCRHWNDHPQMGWCYSQVSE
jgi:hypothetical protein